MSDFRSQFSSQRLYDMDKSGGGSGGGDKGPGMGNWPMILAAIAVVLFGGLIWYAYNSAQDDPYEQLTASLETGNQPIKVEPTNPGGMEVQNQGQSIYGAMQNPSAQAPATDQTAGQQVVGQGEQPVTRTDNNGTGIGVATGPNAGTNTTAGIGTGTDATTGTTGTVNPASNGTQTAAIDQNQGGTIQSQTQDKISDVLGAAGTNFYVVQLMSGKEMDEVKGHWPSLKEKYKSVLGEKIARIQEVEIKSQNATFYRLQAGPYDSMADAQAACVELKKAGQDCFPVKNQ